MLAWTYHNFCKRMPMLFMPFGLRFERFGVFFKPSLLPRVSNRFLQSFIGQSRDVQAEFTCFVQCSGVQRQ